MQGPAFVPSGIFKPAYFITLGAGNDTANSTSSATSSVTFGPTLFIEEKSIEISKVGQKPSIRPNETADWLVNVTLALRSSDNIEHPSIVVSFPELNISSDELPIPSLSAETSQATFVSVNFTIPDGVPQRWYTHNLGTPKLYNIIVNVLPSNVSFTTTTGFRTIVLVQQPYPQSEIEERGITPGDQYHFEINGKAFYSLGTNIIPFDPFYSRMTTAQVRWIIESAVLSGQNMVSASDCECPQMFILPFSCGYGEVESTSHQTKRLGCTTSTRSVTNSVFWLGASSSFLMSFILSTTSSWSQSHRRLGRMSIGSIGILVLHSGQEVTRLRG